MRDEIETAETPIDYQTFAGMTLSFNTPLSAACEIKKVEDMDDSICIHYRLGDEDVSIPVKKDLVTKEDNAYKITSPTPFAETGTTELLITPKP